MRGPSSATPLRFSIVIPAHNEERYLARTLEAVRALAYPKERYEAIVVENGSTDKTFELAERFVGGNITVLQSEQGVSKAKNAGIDRMSPKSDWVVFLDADTVLAKDFLTELGAHLRRLGEEYVVGTTSILPLPDSRAARWWFAFYDFGHRLTKTSYSIKIVRCSLFPPLRFDETLCNGEDLKLTSQARTLGKYFFLQTKNVFTSTRRFEAVGWWKTLFMWIGAAILPAGMRRNLTYKVVR